MTVGRPKRYPLVAVAGIVGCWLIGVSSRAWAQEHTGDPYKPYNYEYNNSVYPTYPSSLGFSPNQGILEGRVGSSRANQFQDYVNDMDGVGVGEDDGRAPRRSGIGVPYYSANRRFDRDYDRVYRPNQSSDRTFYQEQQSRHEKYLEYLRERDPKRRAQLYRAYTQDSMKASRELDSPRSALSRTRESATVGAAPEPRSGLGARRGTASSSVGSSVRRPSSLTAPRSSRAASPSEVLRRSEDMGTSGASPRRTTPAPRPSSLLDPR